MDYKFGHTPLFYERIMAFLIDLVISIGLCLFPRIGWMFGLVYFLLRDSLPFNNGQSYGRRVFKIRVVQKNDNTSILGLHEKSLMRQISLLIPGFNLFECYTFFFKNDRYGAIWSDTKVIGDEHQSLE